MFKETIRKIDHVIWLRVGLRLGGYHLEVYRCGDIKINKHNSQGPCCDRVLKCWDWTVKHLKTAYQQKVP